MEATLLDLVNVPQLGEKNGIPALMATIRNPANVRKFSDFSRNEERIFVKDFVDHLCTRHSMGFDRVELEDRPKAASLQKTTHTVHQSVEETLIQSPQKSHNISVK